MKSSKVGHAIAVGVVLAAASVSSAAVIQSATGYSVSLVSEGAYLNGPVPANLALASGGGVAFTNSDFGSPHVAASLNNGTYGNSSSWIEGGTRPNPPGPGNAFAGVVLPGFYTLTGFAWGRDNTTGGFGDRVGSEYLIQISSDSPIDTTGAGTWTTIARIWLDAGTDHPTWASGDTGFGTENGVSMPNLHQRHEYAVTTSLSGGLNARGIRILHNVGGIAIDEIEAFGSVVPEPASMAVLTFAAGAALRRRRA
jgi:hypothetical protein